MNLRENFYLIFLSMGGLGLLLFLPAYFLLQKGIIDYKSLLLFEGIFFASPHLFSSYFRAYTDSEEIKRYTIYTAYLPIVLFLILFSYIYFYGLNTLWIIGSIYFYWQWWHHARQSFGLGRQYQKQSNFTLNNLDLSLNDYALWSTAILGILLKSSLADNHYEGIPIKTFVLPNIVFYIFIFLIIFYLLFYTARQVYLHTNQKIIQSNFLIHLILQSIVFIWLFGLLPTDIGIIGASFWHCTQYITFVKNHQKHKALNQLIKNPFWYNLFAKENWFIYLGILFIFSCLLPILKFNLSNLEINGLALAFSLSLTFHHYLLDGILWTKNEIKWSLGLT